MDLEAESKTFGVRTIADLGWKDLLDGFTCTECGRCTEVCPANATGKSLDPRAMIMGIRHLAVDAERGLNLIPNSPLVRETCGLTIAWRRRPSRPRSWTPRSRTTRSGTA